MSVFRIPLANARGSEMLTLSRDGSLLLSRDREEAVVKRS
jgi:hypothetical protein